MQVWAGSLCPCLQPHYSLFLLNEAYRYFNSSDLSRNDTVKNVMRAVVKGMRSRTNFIISLPSLVGTIFNIIQHVMNMKKAAINVLIADVTMCLCPVILSFLCRRANKIIIWIVALIAVARARPPSRRNHIRVRLRARFKPTMPTPTFTGVFVSCME